MTTTCRKQSARATDRWVSGCSCLLSHFNACGNVRLLTTVPRQTTVVTIAADCESRECERKDRETERSQRLSTAEQPRLRAQVSWISSSSIEEDEARRNHLHVCREPSLRTPLHSLQDNCSDCTDSSNHGDDSHRSLWPTPLPVAQ